MSMMHCAGEFRIIAPEDERRGKAFSGKRAG